MQYDKKELMVVFEPGSSDVRNEFIYGFIYVIIAKERTQKQ